MFLGEVWWTQSIKLPEKLATMIVDGCKAKKKTAVKCLPGIIQLNQNNVKL